ncbi:hypothetical protein [Nocardia sp. BMG51109]|uniref:hypothetical protein n=1 Tax=Nocardia sp. BMG51109 TaxID=1056816 RepID=UPI0012EC7EFB|nr:hypothetical protein [Nocardia sp. BMG51109]
MTHPPPDTIHSRRPARGPFLTGLVIGVVGGVVVTTVAAVALFMHRTHTVQTYPAPTGDYAAAVKRVHSPMDDDRYEVWLGRLAADDVPRGHVVTIPLAWSTEPRIDWNQDTVVLHFEPGGEIRVPVTMVLDTR